MQPNKRLFFGNVVANIAIAMALLIGFTGCAATNYIVSPYDKLTVIANKDVNPDGSGRPSPIQIKVYQLTSRTTLDNLDFDKLFYRGEDFLSDELLEQKEFILQPKEELKHEIALVSGVTHIAVLAAYRDIDSTRWKHLYKINDTGYYSHKLMVTQQGLVDVPKSQKKQQRRRRERD